MLHHAGESIVVEYGALCHIVSTLEAESDNCKYLAPFLLFYSVQDPSPQNGATLNYIGSSHLN